MRAIAKASMIPILSNLVKSKVNMQIMYMYTWAVLSEAEQSAECAIIDPKRDDLAMASP